VYVWNSNSYSYSSSSYSYSYSTSAKVGQLHMQQGSYHSSSHNQKPKQSERKLSIAYPLPQKKSFSFINRIAQNTIEPEYYRHLIKFITFAI
jgi:hypothetical protein